MADRWSPARFVYTGHAVKQMFARTIDPGDVRHVVDHGEVIAEYPEDTPHQSRLLLAFVNERPLHVVLAYDASDGTGYIVTVYDPAPDLWEPDFKNRRQS